MEPQREVGEIPQANAPKLYELLNSNENAETAVESLKDLIWDTQVKEKKKIKSDDRTGIFIYMNEEK